MSRRTSRAGRVIVVLWGVVSWGAVAVSAAQQPRSTKRPRVAERQSQTAAESVKRGEYLVNVTGCHDCHTPLTLGANGPEPDMSRMLSGHPEAMAMPPAPTLSEPWMASVAATMTAWAGPWGTSYTANLTPDPETGLGSWTEQQFVDAIRSGRHQGRGRPILPPMPWAAYAKLTDADLAAIFAYLRSIPALKNRVPDPAFAPAPGAKTAATQR